MQTAVVPADPMAVARCEKRAEELTSAGFALLHADDFDHLLADADLAALQACWNDLPLDEAMPDGATYRRRRYGRLRAELGSDGVRLTVLPHAAFQQSAELNPIHGGRPRMFAPIPPDALLAPGVRALVGFDVTVASMVSGLRSWAVNLHMVRIVSPRDGQGQPTPEGRHQDGHLFVGMHLLRRSGCTGGESIVYRDDEPVTRLTMTAPLDSMMVDDHRVSHEVTPIVAVDDEGVRDMLLVDLNEG